MTVDPFESLLGSPAPVPPPDRSFVHALRAQVQEGLGLTPAEQRAGNLFYFSIPAPDRDRSRQFWSGVLGWELEAAPSGFNIEGQAQAGGLNAESPGDGPTVWVRVTDIHAAARKVESLGGVAGTPVEYPTGWSLDCTAPGGTRFNLSVPAAAYEHPPSYGRSHGDLFYMSLPVPDADQGRRFFGELVGWQFDDPGEQGGIHVSNVVTECGLGAGRDGEHPELFFRVDDLEASGNLVVAHGGSVLSEVMEGPEGRHLMCDDGQGITFGLSEPADGY